MLKKYLLILSISLSYFSCTYREDKNTILSSFERRIKIKAEETLIIGDSIANPYLMDNQDSIIFLVDLFTKKLVSTYNCNTGELIKRFATKGKGPDEILWITSIDVSNHTIMLYDNTQKRINTTDFNNVIKDSIIHFKSIKIKTDSNLVTPLKAFSCSKNYILMGLIKENQFCQIDSNGYPMNYFDNYPVEKNFKLAEPLIENACAYNGYLKVRQDNRKAIYGTTHGVILKFYNIENNNFVKIKEYIYNQPKYNTKILPGNMSGISFMKNDICGVIDLKVTNRYCYVLFCGYTFEENSDKLYTSNNILVYNWDGQPYCILALNKNVKMFAVDERSKRIYAYSDEDLFPKILWFDISRILD